MTDNKEDIRKNLQRKLEGIMGTPFTMGNHIQILRNGNQIFPEMLSAIEAAKISIHFATYVYWKGEIAVRFAEALSNKARQGIQVKVLLDSYGANLIEQDLLDLMTEAGVTIRWFRPLTAFRITLLDNRTHRKILVVDGEIGFTGGVGIAKEWEGDARNENEWRDTHFRITGPAIYGLSGAFYANWAETGDPYIIHSHEDVIQDESGTALIQVIRSTTTAGWSDIVTLFYALIGAATQSIKISTAYFVLDEAMQEMLIKTAQSGVEINILIPGEHTDQRLSMTAGQEKFTALLKAGIGIHEYQPTMIHTKIILIDNMLACLGSPNFNQRSMAKDEEIALCVIDEDTVSTLSQQFADDIGNAAPYDLDKWQNRGFIQRLKEKFATLFKDQM